MRYWDGLPGGIDRLSNRLLLEGRVQFSCPGTAECTSKQCLTVRRNVLLFSISQRHSEFALGLETFKDAANGIIPERDNDTFGLGYYYMDMSDDLADFISVDTEQGIEFFYNIEVNPWLHVTPDLQYIIDPGGGAYDDAIVFGIRAVMTF